MILQSETTKNQHPQKKHWHCLYNSSLLYDCLFPRLKSSRHKKVDTRFTLYLLATSFFFFLTIIFYNFVQKIYNFYFALWEKNRISKRTLHLSTHRHQQQHTNIFLFYLYAFVSYVTLRTCIHSIKPSPSIFFLSRKNAKDERKTYLLFTWLEWFFFCLELEQN